MQDLSFCFVQDLTPRGTRPQLPPAVDLLVAACLHCESSMLHVLPAKRRHGNHLH